MRRIFLILVSTFLGLVSFYQFTVVLDQNQVYSASRPRSAANTARTAVGISNLQPSMSDNKIYLPFIVNSPQIPVHDMTRFMVGDGRLYEVRFSDDSQARHQTQTEDSRFWHTKGNEVLAEWEELWFDSSHIYRGTDTSPGNDQYYTLFAHENGAKGSKWSPRFWNVGDIFERNPYVVFYNKSDCSTVTHGSVRSWLLFEAYYPSFTFQTGITLQEVVQLAWLLDPDGFPEERYYYAKDYGLVGWRSESHGHSVHSVISEIHEPGTRPDNTREIIDCLNDTFYQPLVDSPRLRFDPLPEEYARLVK